MSRRPAPRPVFRAVLLRVLLCLALLANGIGAAGASARVAVMGVESAVAERLMSETPPVSDCHGAGTSHAAPTAHATHGTSHDDPAHAGHGDDCLQFCLDACLQHCHAMVALAVPFVLAVRTAAPLPETGTGRASAPQLPLLRPPIA